MQSGPPARPAQVPESPPGPPASRPSSSTGLGSAGVVLLLVGWILGVVMAFFSVLVLLGFLVMRRFMEGPMGRFQPDFMPFWMHEFGAFTNMFIWFSVLTFVMLLVSTLLLYMGWVRARRGEGRQGGILGIVGGVIALLFSTWVGLVGLLGGIFVLVAANRDGGTTATAAGHGQPAGPGPIAGQYRQGPR